MELTENQEQVIFDGQPKKAKYLGISQIMQLIAHNDQNALFSDYQTTKLISVGNFKLIGTLPTPFKIANLQSGTSIAALANQTQVRIYNFQNQQDIYDFQSNLKICKVGLLKNLLIVLSNQRILIHDLKSKTNKYYIPIERGEHAFFSNDYYYLKIAYCTQPHLLACRELWVNKISKIEGVNYTKGAFSVDTENIGLVLKNVLSIYNQKELLSLYSFEHEIDQLVPVGPYFFVKLEDGAIFGCGVAKQVHFQQYEQILVDFWDHEHQSVIIAGKQELYEMGKGLVRKYRLQHAQLYIQRQAKNIMDSVGQESG